MRAVESSAHFRSISRLGPPQVSTSSASTKAAHIQQDWVLCKTKFGKTPLGEISAKFRLKNVFSLSGDWKSTSRILPSLASGQPQNKFLSTLVTHYHLEAVMKLSTNWVIWLTTKKRCRYFGKRQVKDALHSDITYCNFPFSTSSKHQLMIIQALLRTYLQVQEFNTRNNSALMLQNDS